jgi:hypothetical protein
MDGGRGASAARHRLILALTMVAVALVVVGLYWFQPWKWWTDQVVDEPLPRIAAVESAAGLSSQAILLSDGELISQEHPTTGSVQLIRLANGQRVLTLGNLRTSNGPTLHVWLTDAPVLPGPEGWDVFDDGQYLDLGDLKGNIGNQIYSVGDDVDLSRYSSVTIWSERFSVSFGAAELSAA